MNHCHWKKNLSCCSCLVLTEWHTCLILSASGGPQSHVLNSKLMLRVLVLLTHYNETNQQHFWYAKKKNPHQWRRQLFSYFFCEDNHIPNDFIFCVSWWMDHHGCWSAINQPWSNNHQDDGIPRFIHPSTTPPPPFFFAWNVRRSEFWIGCLFN